MQVKKSTRSLVASLERVFVLSFICRKVLKFKMMRSFVTLVVLSLHNSFASFVSRYTPVTLANMTSGSSSSSLPCKQIPISTTMAVLTPMHKPTVLLAMAEEPTSTSTSK